ncbi:DUF1918 domain-containing protein [Saccharopolyspora oryzae]|uniref:DUF1918 domain-containing protein n=2 Tax=Saccharopolyspora oryzae TaxID=2997343 RepID=A0ABT4V2H8_9PSEU|nr:DUF1918 domain-containing protein [Saccharopolyspora oryzae]MDA3628165.1 DUF1918 domain-containing protein [Saccharopolyspora oryzae]
MRAEVGDWLVVEAVHLGGHRRQGQIVEVCGREGGEPFRVHWLDDGRVTLFFPGPDTHLEHHLPHHLKLNVGRSTSL